MRIGPRIPTVPCDLLVMRIRRGDQREMLPGAAISFTPNSTCTGSGASMNPSVSDQAAALFDGREQFAQLFLVGKFRAMVANCAAPST